MKIAIAQIKPIKGDISENIEIHKNFIGLALEMDADAVFFPELSLTGYEPELAEKLAMSPDDNRLNSFQGISDSNNIIIGLGLPTKAEIKIRISMLIFEPNRPRKTYSKQQLHPDEFLYFENGIEQVVISKGNVKIAPAICYESLQKEHSENSLKMGANIYLASVAKSENGIAKAFKRFPIMAKQYKMPVLMSNSIGHCDNFLSVGNSSVWAKDGRLIGQLDENTEGILLFDTQAETAIRKVL